LSSKPGGEADPITRVAEFFSHIDGVDFAVIASQDGFPLSFTGVEREETDEIVSLAIDLENVSRNYLEKLARGEGPREGGRGILLEYGEGRVIDISRVRDLLVIAGGGKPVIDASRAAVMFLSGKTVECPYCGADLTLEKARCPRCGRVIPFIADRCPHCGADVRVKKCPHCGRPVTHMGGRVALKRPPIAAAFASSLGVAGGALALLASYLLGASTPITLASAVAGFGLVWAASYAAFPKRPVPQATAGLE